MCAALYIKQCALNNMHINELNQVCKLPIASHLHNNIDHVTYPQTYTHFGMRNVV